MSSLVLTPHARVITLRAVLLPSATAVALLCGTAFTAHAALQPGPAGALRSQAVGLNQGDTQATRVNVGAESFPLSGTNVERAADQLVRYTRTATQPTTPTNRWGLEAVVVGGKVVAVSDRLVTGAGPVTIPADGFVLSGHNIAREWLVRHATLGQSVTVGDAAPPTPAPVPTPLPAPLPPPTAGPTPPASEPAAQAGGSAHPLSGTNVERQADQLVRYTRTATQTTTPTNRWGVEVVVVGGKVVAVSDRLVTGAGAVTIPADGFVLSGHNTARDWLVRHAPVGQGVSVGSPTPTPTPPPAPAPVPPAPPAPAPAPPAAPRPSGASAAARLLGAAPSGGAWFSGIWTGGFMTSQRTNAFGAWRGAPVDGATTYPAYQTWQQIVDSNWEISTFAQVPGRLLYGLPLLPKDGSGSLADVGAGKYDWVWSNVAADLKANGRGNAVVRIGLEANGEWFPWGASTANAAQFKAAFRRVSQVLKQTAPNLLVDYNVACGRGLAGSTDRLAPLTILYPGDDAVDIVGCDHYDAWSTKSTDEASWSQSITPRFGTGLADLAVFARARGKGFSVPEWGLTQVSAAGAGDNPFFITKMREFFEANKDVLVYEAYFNEPDAYLRSSIWDTVQNPLSSARYSALW